MRVTRAEAIVGRRWIQKFQPCDISGCYLSQGLHSTHARAPEVHPDVGLEADALRPSLDEPSRPQHPHCIERGPGDSSADLFLREKVS
jgi:hypothetical protein